MTEVHLHPVPQAWKERAWCDAAQYEAMYRRSIDDPEGFWGDEAASHQARSFHAWGTGWR